MKKILISFCLFIAVLAVCAQGSKNTKQPTQQDLDKALKDAQDLINKQDLPPEAKELLKNSTLNPADITKSIQIDKATMDAYKNQPKGIINTDTIIDEEEEAEMRLASIGTTSTQKIGPEGGVVTSKNGKVKLTIPKGALTKLTEIRIVETKNESPNGCGNSFDLLPDGLVFNKPAKLTLKYTSNEINGTHPKALRILTQLSDGDYEVDMNTTVDIYNKIVSSEISHFSNWGFASVVNLHIEPYILFSEIMKGQTIKLSVKGWTVRADQKKKDEGKLLISNDTKYMEDEYHNYFFELMNKNENKSAPEASFDNRVLVGFFKVKNWELKGDNPNANNLGVLTPVSKDLNEATYTAPKIISNFFQTRIINIFVNLDINEKYPLAFLIKDKDLQLMKRVRILEDGEMNFKIGKTNVTALELTSTKYAKLMANKEKASASKTVAQKVTAGITSSLTGEQKELYTSVICYIKSGKLYIKTNDKTNLMGDEPIVGLSLCISNPKEGVNILDGRVGTIDDDALLYGTFENNDDFTADLTEVKRKKNSKGDCDYSNIYHSREFYLDVFEDKVGGVISGSFKGTVFQDGEKFDDVCESSKELFLSGKFTLTISDIQK
ncbi:MAG: hypothetical protein KA536_23740 [Saprospiraceae bacterium]|nr:hypothetical protein [Saprospiraceae bacterium]